MKHVRTRWATEQPPAVAARPIIPLTVVQPPKASVELTLVKSDPTQEGLNAVEAAAMERVTAELTETYGPSGLVGNVPPFAQTHSDVCPGKRGILVNFLRDADDAAIVSKMVAYESHNARTGSFAPIEANWLRETTDRSVAKFAERSIDI